MTIDELLLLPWSMQITRGAKQVMVYGPELKIIGKGSTLSEALANFEAKQKQYFSEMIENGLSDQIPLPQQTRRRKKVMRTLGVFWAKHFALALFYAVVFIAAGKVVGKSIGKAVAQVNKEWGIFTAADGTPDKNKRLENFKEDMANLTPFMKELRKAWKESEKP